MAKDVYKMKFADGVTIDVVPDGCGNWLSDDITAAMIVPEKISMVEISLNGTVIEKKTDQICEGIYPYHETKGFCLREKTFEEIVEDALIELADIIAGGE